MPDSPASSARLPRCLLLLLAATAASAQAGRPAARSARAACRCRASPRSPRARSTCAPGPSTDHPIRWVYARAGLPVRIVEEFDVWRRIEDPDGETGWAHASLLSVRRTAMVRGDGRAGRCAARPRADARVVARVEPGVDRRASRAARAAGAGSRSAASAAGCQATALWGVDAGGLLGARAGSGLGRRAGRVAPCARLGAADAHHDVDPVDHLARAAARAGAGSWIASSGTSMISPVDLSK